MKTLNEQLQDFLSLKVEPKLEKKKIEKEQNRVRDLAVEILGSDLVDHFLMGSYIRSTLTKRLKKDEKYDVDVMLVYSEQTYSESDLPDLMDKTEELAEDIKEKIAEIQEVRPQKVSIGLLYEDNLKIDLVPAVAHGTKFKIYDSRNGKSVITNPKQHNTDLTAANESDNCNKLLVPLIKLVKRWKDKREPDTFKSFHLERLAIQIFTDMRLENYLVGLREFFQKAYIITSESTSVTDPVNSENDVSSYLDDEKIRLRAAEALAKAGEACQEAIEYEEEDMKKARRALGRLYDHFQSEADAKVATGISTNFSTRHTPSPHYKN